MVCTVAKLEDLHPRWLNTEKLLFALRNEAAHFSFPPDFTSFFCVTYSKFGVTPKDEETQGGREQEEMESGSLERDKW